MMNKHRVRCSQEHLRPGRCNNPWAAVPPGRWGPSGLALLLQLSSLTTTCPVMLHSAARQQWTPALWPEVQQARASSVWELGRAAQSAKTTLATCHQIMGLRRGFRPGQKTQRKPTGGHPNSPHALFQTEPLLLFLERQDTSSPWGSQCPLGTAIGFPTSVGTTALHRKSHYRCFTFLRTRHSTLHRCWDGKNN